MNIKELIINLLGLKFKGEMLSDMKYYSKTIIPTSVPNNKNSPFSQTSIRNFPFSTLKNPVYSPVFSSAHPRNFSATGYTRVKPKITHSPSLDKFDTLDPNLLRKNNRYIVNSMPRLTNDTKKIEQVLEKYIDNNWEANKNENQSTLTMPKNQESEIAVIQKNRLMLEHVMVFYSPITTKIIVE